MCEQTERKLKTDIVRIAKTKGNLIKTETSGDYWIYVGGGQFVVIPESDIDQDDLEE